MAQLAYNDHAVQKHFDNVTWVSVSNLFYEKKVAKGIIQGLEKISSTETYGLEAEPLQVLLERISNSIKGKKFLLVLDDVWVERGETWESIKVTLKSGAPGSRILVTTRDVNVARMKGSSFSQIFLLEKVDDEVCWLILKEIALGGRKDWRNLEEIGRKIAIKCKGLPLAAKTLGSHLKSRRTKQQWEDVLNSEIWKLDLAQKDIFAPLLLSYYDLPPPVRQCVMYCVIYPKNHLIWVHDLIDRWMAQGYLGFDNDADLESIGQHYFDILASRSFFQDFEHHEHGTLLTCKMHDMIHDFAWYLVENEFVTKEVQYDNITIELEKSHHFTLVLHDKMSFPSSISGAKKLRSLVTFSVGGSGTGNSILELLPSLLNQSRCLRLLDFHYARVYLGKKVPKEIGKLIHLRQLDLSFTQIKELPEELSNLLNLLNLDFMGCERLKELPSWISKLLNLRFFRTSACHILTHYPKDVGRLTSLRHLLGAIVRADCINDAEQFSFADIGNMKHLRSVCLKVMGDRINKDEARKSQLQKIQELRIYLTGKIDKDDIVKALDPPSDVNL